MIEIAIDVKIDLKQVGSVPEASQVKVQQKVKESSS